MEALIASHIKVSLGNKYSNILTARNAKVTSTRIVYEKTNETEGFQRRI